MARYTGAVRFADGELLYFVYNGTVDQCRERLYRTVADADARRHDRDAICAERESAHPDERSEVVDVMPYFAHGSKDVMFQSRADRNALVFTGPLSVDAVTEEYLKQNE